MKNRAFRRPKLRTCLLLLPLAFLGLVAIHFLVLPTVHRRFGLCPLTLSRFAESKAMMPINEGYALLACKSCRGQIGVMHDGLQAIPMR